MHYFDQKYLPLEKNPFSAKLKTKKWRNENEQLYFIEQCIDS
ncbi:hypothetical protein HSIEG1_508 [Enterococcus sp. HSIEG1]|nr:hypothetical protein HSIEG1_508 [Enterococcus sp. HSIEG1]